MKLTKYGHACVRLEKDGNVLVVDPGPSPRARSSTAPAPVLITHEHIDHLTSSGSRAASPGLEIWTCEAVAAQLVDLPGEGPGRTAWRLVSRRRVSR